IEAVQKKFGATCLPLQLPIGAASDFSGIVDLLRMNAYTGSPAKETEIPAALKPQVDSYRLKLIEAIASTDEKLIEKYLSDEQLSQEELEQALRNGVATGKIVPILCSSALKGIGVTALMDAVVKYLPSPREREVIVQDKQGTQKVPASPDTPLAALVFKTTADPYVGKLTFFRVYTGAINSNSQVWNATKNEQERIGQLFLIRGKNQEAVPSVSAGDIGAVAKLNVTSTGDTLSTKDKPVKLPATIFPEPIYSLAISPKTKADLDKLSASLARLLEEDPTLRMRREAGTSETIISGLGETQLEVATERMHRKFGVGVKLDIPKVPYKETVTATATGDFRHKKQTGGHGQFGHVTLDVAPLPRGSGVEFVDAVVGGSIPRNYIPAAEKGIYEAAQEGVLAGFPVVDIRARLFDGSFHPVDSSDICFKIAGAGALKKALADARPVLLEPIVKLKVTVPDNHTGDIISDLNNKRGRVLGISPEDGKNVIEAQVPQAEVLRYAIDLKSMTQGRGRYTYEFSHYEEVPSFVAPKVIAERQAQKEQQKAEKE
ncbi:MAG: elongation factor G, partial [Dehalococcoidia bacterium]|nr:elongation factor G [Dehalococcoidia bacterium]